MEKKRCKTGFEELDVDLSGGIPVGNTVLIAGASGVGKTTLSMQFLANGIEIDETGVFFTATEPISKLKQHLKGYSFFKNDHFK